MRIQLEFSSTKVIDELKIDTDSKTIKELFNNALTLLKWSVQQRKSGQIIVAIDTETGSWKELQMPALEHCAITSPAAGTQVIISVIKPKQAAYAGERAARY